MTRALLPALLLCCGRPEPPPPPVHKAPTPAAPAAAHVGGPDFAAVFAAVSPSVVGVAGGTRTDGRFRADRTGTGFAWDGAGHVVTNDHLVREGDAWRVRTVSGQVLAATIAGRDEPTDLAVLKVEPPLPPVRIGAATPLRPGAWVAAIGNPYGMEHSITVGVVSALGRRDLPGGGPRYAAYIQTDLSINPGNSGGPLVDGSGAVVGINTAILGKGQGLSFAIPMEMARVVVAHLIEHGRFVRGFGGLVVGRVSQARAHKAGLDRPRGARVREVVEGGPADAAGLRVGDLILRYGDTELSDANSLPWLIASTAPGARVPLHVAREAGRLDLKMAVAEAP